MIFVVTSHELEFVPSIVIARAFVEIPANDTAVSGDSN